MGGHVPLLQEGTVVRETYTVERLLGEGASAEVYRVNHRFLGRQAMKVFKVPSDDANDVEDDIQEALLLSSMKHPNLVEIYDANILKLRSNSHGYFTMNYMPGGTLERFWRSFGAKLMPVEAAVEIVRQVARGLTLAHGRTPPIIHRDIKPANILIGFGPDLVARLSDFGLAKAVSPLTLLASAKGTVGFKPPEAFDNMDSCAADVWAIGTTLYLILTDEMPFPQLNARDTRDASKFLRPLRPPSLYNASVDSGLESIIFRCLAAKPEDRYPNAAQLLHDLERWVPNAAPISYGELSEGSGSKFGVFARSQHDLEAEARQALSEALSLAQDPTQLAVAADLLEEAISKAPALGEQHLARLRLWRRGVMSAFAPKSEAKRKR